MYTPNLDKNSKFLCLTLFLSLQQGEKEWDTLYSYDMYDSQDSEPYIASQSMLFKFQHT